jgi:hypothetical protein
VDTLIEIAALKTGAESLRHSKTLLTGKTLLIYLTILAKKNLSSGVIPTTALNGRQE